MGILEGLLILVNVLFIGGAAGQGHSDDADGTDVMAS